MRFAVLGRLQVISDDGTEVRVRQPKQRAMLTVLLLHANQELSVSRLTESLWEHDGQALSVGALRTQVWALRKLLAADNRLHTGDYGGYRLEIRPGELDAAEFGRLAGQGRHALRAGDLPGAVSFLTQALALWAEPALADVPATLAMGPVARRLLDERAVARDLLTEARLGLGQHADLIPELRAGTAADSANERLWQQLMLALHRAGRTGDALAAYQQARTSMKAELGLEPGHDLQQLHRRILTNDPVLAASGPAQVTRPPFPPDYSRPRQLPPPVPDFVGRSAELGELTALPDAPAGRGTTMIAAISGPAGVGKTALAVHWAHQAAGSFPDGHLYLNLDGFGPGGRPVTQETAVSRVLEALQVPTARIPSSLDGRVGLYRTLFAERRMLIVLDNARDAEQVRPLLPGGTGNMVLVTSRSSLAGLVALDGARAIPLDVLTEPEARRMVAQRLGPDRAAADPAATGQLIDACARLPLALAIATALIATRPAQSLTSVIGGLASDAGRLDALNTGEATTDLRAVFDWSYRALSPASARMFRLLAEHPGPDIGVAVAASLTGLPPGQATDALTELSHLHLIDEPAPGRFGLHDLLRLYAAEMLGAHDSAAERRAAGRRMLDYYLRTAWAAALAISPPRKALDLGPAVAGASPEDLADSGEATAWLKAEHQVLMRVIGYAADHGFDACAWQLPWALNEFLDRGGHWPDFAASQEVALAAAARLGDVSAQANSFRIWIAHFTISAGPWS
jgi:DNA-binding SARP family transcriptional activator